MPRPSLFIFMGLIASGKSTLAEAFAKQHGCRYYNSDVERKKLAQIELATRGDSSFEGGIYTPEYTRLTYDTLIAKAKLDIEVDRSVVLDGSYSKQAERQILQAAFGASAVRLVFILCTVSTEITRQRLVRRALDETAVSDGTYAIYVRQKQGFEYPKELDPQAFITIETDGDIEQLLTTLAASLNIPPF